MSDNIIAIDCARNIDADVNATVDAEKIITQDGIAKIFAERHVDRLRYCHSAAAWFEFTGTHWRRDQTKRAFEFVRDLAREKSEGRKEHRTMRSVAFANGVERFAQSDPLLAVTADQWDRDPYLLGTPGGTVDLRTGKMGPAAPGDMITKITAVAPTEYLDFHVWPKFVSEAAGGDDDLIRFLQQWAGYCLTGDTREHALVFGYGPGGNGKSVFLSTVMGIMGAYAVMAPAETFATSFGDRHPTELAMLRGARFVGASETEQGRTWAESRIKQLTGGDKIAARLMRQDFFEFLPEFKLTIIGNYQPQLHNVDDALRRRFNIVPFTHRPAKPDHGLETALRDEWPEILRWMIEGCLDWQQNGLMRSDRVMEATETYFSDQDLLGQWLTALCNCEPGDNKLKEPSTALYASWAQYAKTAGTKPESQKAFAGNLQKRGFVPIRTKAFRGYAGIALKLMTGDG